jgi:hypothetical protein
MPVASGSWAVGETPAPDFPVNGFAAKWIGSMVVESGGWYTFYLSSRDGGRLYINDVELIDSYHTRGGWRKASDEVYLWPGHHVLVADMCKAPQRSSSGSKALVSGGPAADIGFTHCAKEIKQQHGSVALLYCSCTGTVRFGVDGSWTERRVHGNIACDKDYFAFDPAPGEEKTCQCRASGGRMTNSVEDNTYQLLQDDAAVALKYKCPDTSNWSRVSMTQRSSRQRLQPLPLQQQR